MKIKKILILFFLKDTFSFIENSNNGIQYDINTLNNKIRLKETLSLSEAQFVFFYTSALQGKTHEFATIAWMLFGIGGSILSSSIGHMKPYILNIILKYKFKNSLKYMSSRYNLNQIAGYIKEKNKIVIIIEDIKNQKLTKNVKQNEGVLFFGTSGCGKTNFVKTIAYESKVPLITILAKDLMNDKGLLVNLDLLFEVLKDIIAKKGPCILFFEEFDFLVGNRANEKLDQNTKLILQNFLDKLGGESALSGLFIIACTNYKENIDEALLRPGRFGNHIEIGRPSEEDIFLLVDFYSKKFNINFEIEDAFLLFISQCSGLTVSEIIRKLKNRK